MVANRAFSLTIFPLAGAAGIWGPRFLGPAASRKLPRRWRGPRGSEGEEAPAPRLGRLARAVACRLLFLNCDQNATASLQLRNQWEPPELEGNCGSDIEATLR
jgi:hypothetical protein